MTLIFLSEESVPTYLAVSSDIVDERIDGASLIGKTISASAGNPDTAFSLSPTITGTGSVVRSLLVGTGSVNKGGGGGSPFSTEFVIPANTKMYMKYTNLDGNDSMWNVLIDFYEA